MFIIAALLATQLASTKPPKHKSSVPDSSAMTFVQVQNNRHVPVRVFAQDGFGEIELGVVPAGTTATLRVADPIVIEGNVDFFVHPQGQPEEDTGSLEVHRGDRLGVLVPERK
jgi:hypothetical protein